MGVLAADRHLTCSLDIAAVTCGHFALVSIWVERHSVPVACLPLPWIDFFQFMLGFVQRFCPFIVTQDQGQAQSLSGDVGLCFPIPSVYCATMVASTVPKWSRAYSFSVFGLDVNVDYVFVLVLPILCSLDIDNIVCAPHSYVQVYAVAAF